MTDSNPYAPPRAYVADVQHAGSGPKRSLLPIWLAALYCILIGTSHAIVLVVTMYRARDMLPWLLPPAAYAAAFIQPAARLAAGISFIRRSRFSPALFVALTVVTAVFPIVWQIYWTSQTGYAFRPGPMLFLALADLMLLIGMTRYAFALRSRGMLR